MSEVYLCDKERERQKIWENICMSYDPIFKEQLKDLIFPSHKEMEAGKRIKDFLVSVENNKE